jgi:hypothetical protein
VHRAFNLCEALHKSVETGIVSAPLPPSAAVPLTKGNTKTPAKINEGYSPPREGESRRRRQGVAHADSLCKAHPKFECKTNL